MRDSSNPIWIRGGGWPLQTTNYIRLIVRNERMFYGSVVWCTLSFVNLVCQNSCCSCVFETPRITCCATTVSYFCILLETSIFGLTTCVKQSSGIRLVSQCILHTSQCILIYSLLLSSPRVVEGRDNIKLFEHIFVVLYKNLSHPPTPGVKTRTLV